MDTRDKEVLNMQFTLMPILEKAWNKSYSELSDIFMKYDVPGYIDVCYEKYNSTGNQGIIDDLKEYIEMQGGSIEADSKAGSDENDSCSKNAMKLYSYLKNNYNGLLPYQKQGRKTPESPVGGLGSRGGSAIAGLGRAQR